MIFKNIDISEWMLNNGLSDEFIKGEYLSDLLERFLKDQIEHHYLTIKKHECENHRVESIQDFCGKCGKTLFKNT